MKKIVIIGGVASGASFATRYRRLNQEDQIILLEKGNAISYANCGLPYHLSNTIKNEEDLLIMTPEKMKSRFNIDVKVNHKVINVIPEKHKIMIQFHDQILEETYDKLVIASGMSPINLPIDGINHPKIHAFWNINDMSQIKKQILDSSIKHIVVMGGGFVGVEVAENLIKLGKQVTLVERNNQILSPFDDEMVQLLHQEMYNHKMQLCFNKEVCSFQEKDKQISLHFKDGSHLTCDFVITALGNQPNTQFINVNKNNRGYIIVDSKFQTSEPDIYAIGDIIETTQLVNHQKSSIALAGPANKQGRMLANILCDYHQEYHGSFGTGIVKIFNLTGAFCGLTERQLIENNAKLHKDYEKIIIIQKSHAGYYPGSSPLTMQLLFDKEGYLLGGQIIGYENVDKNIDIIATCLHFHGTINDLTKLDLAYAPPFSSAKSATNMLGFVAENVLNHLVKIVTPKEYMNNNNYYLIDVRTKEEFNQGFIQDAQLISYDDIYNHIDDIPYDKNILLYCGIGVRAYNVARILSTKGFKNISVLAGGYQLYKIYQESKKQCSIKINNK